MSQRNRYAIWRDGQPSSFAVWVEANTTRSAILTLAKRYWDDESWDGDQPLILCVKLSNGEINRYVVCAGLALNLSASVK